MFNTLEKVRTGYDNWAAVYDHDANPLIALEEPRVRAAVGDVSDLRVLDMGCGTGRHALWLAAQGAQVTALDFSEGMLAEAKQKPLAKHVTFLQHDLNEPLPFEPNSFDLVVSGLVLEHISDLDLFFGEARRVLNREGRAVISAMHPAMFLRGSQARYTDPDSGEVVHVGSISHSVSDFVMAAVRAGFQIECVTEHSPDEEFASRYPRAEKYVDWPMLVVMALKPFAV